MRISRKTTPVYANEAVDVAPEASELLFETADVAELLAEVTGNDIEVTAEGDTVNFAVIDEEGTIDFTVTAEGDEEIVESARTLRGKKAVEASAQAEKRTAPARRPASRTVAAATKTVKRYSPSKK